MGEFHLDVLGFGLRLFVPVDDLFLDLLRLLGPDGLHPLVKGPSPDGLGDLHVVPIGEHPEDLVLLRDLHVKDAVQELSNIRQLRFVEGPGVGVDQSRQSRGVLKFPDPHLCIAVVHVDDELPQGFPCFLALEIVPGGEKPLTTCLSFPSGEGAELVQPSGNRGDEPLLSLQVGRDENPLGGLLLVGPVGPSEALNGPVGSPPGLHEVLAPQFLILGCEIRVVASSRSACVGEDKDFLLAGHELIGVGHALVLSPRFGYALLAFRGLLVDHPA